jgi:hypothetical protein
MKAADRIIITCMIGLFAWTVIGLPIFVPLLRTVTSSIISQSPTPSGPIDQHSGESPALGSAAACLMMDAAVEVPPALVESINAFNDAVAPVLCDGRAEIGERFYSLTMRTCGQPT